MIRQRVIVLANEDPRDQGNEDAPQIGLANAFAVLQKDVLRIPYGRSVNGKYVQDFNRACADEMLANFQSLKAEDPSFKIPIYIGHPDHPAFADQCPDKAAYAWISNMTPLADGLLLNADWSPDGSNILSQGKFRYMSPNWDCRLSKSDARVANPFKLISVGLTNMPNIRAIGALVNTAEQQNKGVQQMKDLLLKILRLANTATEAEIQEAAKDVDIPALKVALANEQKAREDDKKAADLALANEKTQRETEKSTAATALANEKAAVKAERGARIELLLANAITAGKITLAQKPQWLADLEKDFDGKVVALANATPVISTESKTKDLGKRKPEMMDRQDKVLSLVNEHMKKTGDTDYVKAFAQVRKEHAELFAGMHQPKSE